MLCFTEGLFILHTKDLINRIINRAQALTKLSTLASSGVKENVFLNMMVLLWKILFLMTFLLSPMMLWVDYSVEALLRN